MHVTDHHIITLSYEVWDGGPGGDLIERMDAHYPFKFLLVPFLKVAYLPD